MKFKGTRKLIALGIIAAALTAISLTLIIVQPPGVDIMEYFTWSGGALAIIKALFIGGNAYEHKVQARGASSEPLTDPQ